MARRFLTGALVGGRWLRLEDGLVDLMHKKSPNRVSEVRKGERKVRGPEGGSGISPGAGFRRKQWQKSDATVSNSSSLAARN
jgi:hypothetical protein